MKFRYIILEILAKKLGYKLCHARKGIHFCRNKKCCNCKYFIDLLKEIDEGSCNDEEVIKE